jgi:hypothetical protein
MTDLSAVSTIAIVDELLRRGYEQWLIAGAPLNVENVEQLRQLAIELDDGTD